MSLEKIVVERYHRPKDFTYKYVASVHISCVMDKPTADANPKAEQWLVETMLVRLISELIEARDQGVEVELKKYGEER